MIQEYPRLENVQDVPKLRLNWMFSFQGHASESDVQYFF